MAQSGIDEFYEVVRLLLVRFLAERNGIAGMPPFAEANKMLASARGELEFILDGHLKLQTSGELYEQLRHLFEPIEVARQDFHSLDQTFELLTSRTYKADKGQYFTPSMSSICVWKQ